MVVRGPLDTEGRARAGKRLERVLDGLRHALRRDLGPLPGPARLPEPLVAFVLPDSTAYAARYPSRSGSPGRLLGHFDPAGLRLVVPAGAPEATLRHEGTHLLLEAAARGLPDPPDRMVWIHEGLAEWFAAAEAAATEGGPPRTGGVHRVWLDLLARDLEAGTAPPALHELLRVPYSAAEAQPERVARAYAGGWALVHFLMRFETNASGVLRVRPPGTPRGRHLQGLRRYVRAVLRGRSGPGTFHACLGTAEEPAGRRRLAERFEAYARWLVHKLRRGQIRDGRLLPWSAVPGGRPEDDRLRVPGG